jgi:riboflavin-specific deaminase-like protein
MALTHQLRSLHRAILVGIGTVLADNPQLTVRLAAGPSPQPVVLDSSLRFPVSARLLSRADHAPWILHSQDAPEERARELEHRGARLFPLPAYSSGLSLEDALGVLAAQGIPSLMVEGGARVLRSFILGHFARQAVVTMSPISLEGVRIFEGGEGLVRHGLPSHLFDFADISEEKHGSDIVLWVGFPLSVPPHEASRVTK